VFIVIVVYFAIDSVRKLLDIPFYMPSPILTDNLYGQLCMWYISCLFILHSLY